MKLDDVFDLNCNDVVNQSDTVNNDEPDVIIRKNIDKANILLDIIVSQVENGITTARMFEVASMLIDKITTAASNLIMTSNNELTLDIKRESLELKKREIDIKEALSLKKSGKTDMNIEKAIICTREDILRQLEENKRT